MHIYVSLLTLYSKLLPTTRLKQLTMKFKFEMGNSDAFNETKTRKGTTIIMLAESGRRLPDRYHTWESAKKSWRGEPSGVCWRACWRHEPPCRRPSREPLRQRSRARSPPPSRKRCTVSSSTQPNTGTSNPRITARRLARTHLLS